LAQAIVLAKKNKMFPVLFWVTSAHLVLRADENVGEDKLYLVQYVGSQFCNEQESKMCQEVSTAFTMTTHKDQTVCTKLHETEGEYEVDACYADGGSCPSETCGDCKGFFHKKLVLDVCNEGYMLKNAKPEGCIDHADIGLGRWCNKVPSKPEEKTEEKLELTSASRSLRNEPLPSQGFEGKEVAHEDYKTTTGDWRNEYGPRRNAASSLLVGMALFVTLF